MPAKKPKNLQVWEMWNLCGKCKRYSICDKLCSKAEIYTNQDSKPNRELLLRRPEIWTNIGITEGVDPISSEHLKQLIIDLHNDGMDDYEIAYHLPCTRQYITLIVQECIKASKKKT
uniref:Uncharacterized protein n=1 Tax=viral metagenome TaxID=1070528 RepID=A0A6M3KYD0_9ZZZZ